MGLNETPASERVHIGFFGKRNAGKSSVMNAVTGQNLAVVSQVKGTTTDPVLKSMELLPLGPVVMMDTPGIDDEGELGSLRVGKSRQTLNKTDAAVLVLDGAEGFSREDAELLDLIRKKEIPWVAVLNKRDKLTEEQVCQAEDSLGRGGIEKKDFLWVSAEKKTGIEELKERIALLAKPKESGKRLVGDLLSPGDLAVLVVPVDKASPKGRLILPQQQTIRDILDAGAMAVVTKETELPQGLAALKEPPRMVITDSQAFKKVSADVPTSIPLTSFSILFARYKGNLPGAIRGVKALESLENGDKVLISEGCTHHRQCNDIGTVKIPNWIRQKTGKEPVFEFTSGGEFPRELTQYKLIVHCGACMLNEREMQSREARAREQGVAMTNYGILIAYVTGILQRSLAPFPEIAQLL